MDRNCTKRLNLLRDAQKRLEYLYKETTRDPVQKLLVDIFWQKKKVVDEEGQKTSDDDDSPKQFRQLLSSWLASGKETAGTKIVRRPADVAYLDTGKDVIVHKLSGKKFDGACVDSDAQIAVIGKAQAGA